jgi:hypothetical protein
LVELHLAIKIIAEISRTTDTMKITQLDAIQRPKENIVLVAQGSSILRFENTVAN